MSYNTVLIKFGELTTKGRNKNKFISTLTSLIATKINKYEDAKLSSSSDRCFVDFKEDDFENIVSDLQEVFGIHAISFVKRSSLNIEQIRSDVIDLLANQKFTSFKVAARRRNKQFEMNSDQINRFVATGIFENYNDVHVDVKKPEIKINIEIRNEESYIYFEEISGMKGLPLGVNGKGMVLLSGGIDSPVAAVLAMKKGIKVNAITFTSPPYTSQKALQKVIDLAKITSKYNNETMKLFEVVFTDIQKFLISNVSERLFMTIQRRSMFRISEALSRKWNHSILITGESLGQVASQTVESITCIHDSISIPVIQPVISFDKSEIVEFAQKINTFETSILPYEDSCTVFLPNNPSTVPSLEKVLKEESRIIDELKRLEAKAIEEFILHKITNSNIEENEINEFI